MDNINYMICKCKNIIPEGRLKLGYSVCVECSTVDRYGCAPITFHKTGNSIQIMSSKDAEALLSLLGVEVTEQC